jgi:orotidine-5'-phosphate decarboxylase
VLWELFTALGSAILEQLHKLNFDVFLDLTFHDIPTLAMVLKLMQTAQKGLQ